MLVLRGSRSLFAFAWTTAWEHEWEVKYGRRMALAVRCRVCAARPTECCRSTVRGIGRGRVLSYPHNARLPPPSPSSPLSERMREWSAWLARRPR